MTKQEVCFPWKHVVSLILEFSATAFLEIDNFLVNDGQAAPVYPFPMCLCWFSAPNMKLMIASPEFDGLFLRLK